MTLRARLLLGLVPTLAAAQQPVSLLPRHESLWTSTFDSARRRLVLFDVNGETWEIDGGEWLHRAPAGSPLTPLGRTGALLAFDSARGHVLMFGGTAPTLGRINDTWTYDGSSWRLLAGSGPGTFTNAAMAFDSVRQRMVLLADSLTWEHDGSHWILRLPTAAPAATSQLKMTFDDNRGVAVVTGENSSGSLVCEWNGQTWSSRATAVAPLRPASLTFDSGRSRVVAITAGASPGLWEWNGSAWSRLTPLPEATAGSVTSWYDAALGQTQLTMAQQHDGQVDFVSTAWDGSVFTLPVRRTGLLQELALPNLIATIPQIVLLSAGGELLAGTWLRDGNGWRHDPTTTTPPPRSQTALAPGFTSAFVFGGISATNSFLDDFWEWNGLSWHQLPSGPGPRVGPSLAVDPVSNRALLFGGLRGSELNDSWLFDGTSWRELAIAGPSPRNGAAMCWDPVRGVAVLHGGRSMQTAPATLHDTWEWNGLQWQQRTTTSEPPTMRLPSMTFDWSRLRMQFAGSTQATPAEDQLWELVDTGWSLRGSRASTFSAGRAVYDWQAEAVVVTNGGSMFEWTTTPARVTAYGSGCGATPPTIALRERARVGSTSGFELHGPAQLPCVFVLDDAGATLPLGNGCTQLVADITMTWFAVTDTHGVASTRVTIPISAARGATAFAQAAILDPTAPGGFATTSGLQITIGN